MRKDKKSQYQLKKEKLLKIKEIVEQLAPIIETTWLYTIDGERVKTEIAIEKIWEIVKDEK